MAPPRSQPLASILGTGLVTPLGAGRDAHVRALSETPPPAAWVGADELEPDKRLPFRPVAGQPAVLAMARDAASEALAAAGLHDADVARAGLFLGSSSLDIADSETAYGAARRNDPEVVPMAAGRSGYGKLADTLAAELGLEGPRMTFNTACSSSANAALYAARMIDSGAIDHALILGTESYNRLSLLGFASLMLVSDSGLRPFDAARDGLVLGEGVGALVLGRARSDCRWHLSGGANLCDTSSATNSRPEAIAEVMRSALRDAGVASDALSAIKAHGTGTPSNDTAEGEGMKLAFANGVPPFTSLKGHFGHTLGACGALETAALMAALEAGFLPGTAGFAETDPALGIAPLDAGMSAGEGYYLLNYFGFGGNNTSMVLRFGSHA